MTGTTAPLGLLSVPPHLTLSQARELCPQISEAEYASISVETDGETDAASGQNVTRDQFLIFLSGTGHPIHGRQDDVARVVDAAIGRALLAAGAEGGTKLRSSGVGGGPTEVGRGAAPRGGRAVGAGGGAPLPSNGAARPKSRQAGAAGTVRAKSANRVRTAAGSAAGFLGTRGETTAPLSGLKSRFPRYGGGDDDAARVWLARVQPGGPWHVAVTDLLLQYPPGKDKELKPGQRVYVQRGSFFWPAVVRAGAAVEIKTEEDLGAAAMKTGAMSTKPGPGISRSASKAGPTKAVSSSSVARAKPKACPKAAPSTTFTLDYLHAEFWDPKPSEENLTLDLTTPSILDEIDRLTREYKAALIVEELRAKSLTGEDMMQAERPSAGGATGGKTHTKNGEPLEQYLVVRTKGFLKSKEQLELNRFLRFWVDCSVLWYLFETSRMVSAATRYLKEHKAVVEGMM